MFMCFSSSLLRLLQSFMEKKRINLLIKYFQYTKLELQESMNDRKNEWASEWKRIEKLFLIENIRSWFAVDKQINFLTEFSLFFSFSKVFKCIIFPTLKTWLDSMIYFAFIFFILDKFDYIENCLEYTFVSCAAYTFYIPENCDGNDGGGSCRRST